MKRSEMLEVIDEVLRRVGNHAGTSREMLTAIEKAGMLPPKIELGDSGFVPTKEILDYTELDYDIIWEPEND